MPGSWAIDQGHGQARQTEHQVPTTAPGQTRSFCDIGSMSGLPESGHGSAIYRCTPYVVRSKRSNATTTTIITITHIQRRIPLSQRLGDRAARCGAAAAAAAAADAFVAGWRRLARPDPCAAPRLRHHKSLSIAVAGDGFALAAVAAGAAPGEARSRGGGAMLASRN